MHRFHGKRVIQTSVGTGIRKPDQLFERVISGQVPIYQSTGDDESLGDKIYKKIVEYSGKIPQVKYGVFNYEARDAIGVAMSGILNGSLTVDSGLAEAQKNVEFLMGY